MSNDNFHEQFYSFFEGCKKIFNEHMQRFPSCNERLVVSAGRRYVRIDKVSANGTSASVFAFVDKTNGDVLKPASYKAPAKGARGNIFDMHNGLAKITPYGPAYLR